MYIVSRPLNTLFESDGKVAHRDMGTETDRCKHTIVCYVPGHQTFPVRPWLPAVLLWLL